MATTTRSIQAHTEKRPWWITGPAIVFAIALVRFAVQAYAIPGYGYFRDELYYLALSAHPMSWGYVDLPPLFVALTKLIRATLGDSLWALRILPAIAAGATVFMAGMLAREMGGKRLAQAIAAIATSCALIYYGLDHILSMNAFEPLFWMGCAWIVLRIANTGNQKLWLWFGVISGLGVLNKYSTVFFAGALILAVLLTPLRNSLKERWVWIGGAIAVVIVLPNFLWQYSHHFPFLELMANIRRNGRDVALPPIKFILQQIVIMNPLTVFVWIGGLWWLLFRKSAKNYRFIGFSFLLLLAYMMAMHGKDYYMAPAYGILYAAGGISLERLTRNKLGSAFAGLVVVLMLASMFLLPYSLPILSEQNFVAFTHRFPIQSSPSENHQQNDLGQFYADMHGWPEMAQQVANAYDALPPDQRANTQIYAMNYGEAGAIDFFGPKLGLPQSFSGHQHYWFWGPKGSKGSNYLVLGRHQLGDLPQYCEEARIVGQVGTQWSIPYEHWPILYCRDLKVDLHNIWPREKSWD